MKITAIDEYGRNIAASINIGNNREIIVLAGKGYRLLNYGEIIESTDEFFYLNKKWILIYTSTEVSKKYSSGHLLIRRHIEATKKELETLIKALEL